MKNILYKNLILGALALALVLPLTVSAAVFNNDPADLSTTMVTNYTLNPTVNTAWALSTTANVGEVISVHIYYHNTIAPDALNTRITLSQPAGQLTAHTFTGSVVADNAPTASGVASVNLTSAQTLNYIPGSLRWYPNQANINTALPLGQTGAEIFTPLGLNLGTVSAGWATQGTVVLRFQVGGVAGVVGQNQPLVRTDSVTGNGSTYAVLNGFVDPLGGAGVSRWFEWGNNSVSFSGTSARIGQGTTAGTFTETAAGLQPNTTYYYRAAAQSGTGQIIYGATMSFTTQVPQNQSPTVITNTPLNITKTSVTLNGYVNPMGTSNTLRYFQWGTNITSLTTQTGQLNYGAAAGDFTQDIANLSADTPYYYRSVAQNSTGIFYGNVISFTTQGAVVTPPAPVSTAKSTSAPKTTTASKVVSSELITMSIDTTGKVVGPGEKVTYIVRYANNSKNSIPKALLKVILPSSLNYEMSSNPNVLVDKGVLSLDIGKLSPSESGSLTFDAIVDKKAKDGENLTVAAVLSYLDSSTGPSKSINDYAVSQVDKNRSQTASVFSSGAGFFGDGFIDWLILIILIAILVFLIRFIFYGDKEIIIVDKKRKELPIETDDEEYESYKSIDEDDPLDK